MNYYILYQELLRSKELTSTNKLILTYITDCNISGKLYNHNVKILKAEFNISESIIHKSIKWLINNNYLLINYSREICITTKMLNLIKVNLLEEHYNLILRLIEEISTVNITSKIKTYFILDQKSNMVKIGKSIYPEQRLKELSTGNPNELFIIKIINKDIEKQLHNEFKAFHYRNEWFNYTKEIQQFLNSISN